MSWSFPFTSPSRQAATTIPCTVCGEPLLARRACRAVFLSCPSCGARFETGDFPERIDELEDFMSAVPCDRI